MSLEKNIHLHYALMDIWFNIFLKKSSGCNLVQVHFDNKFNIEKIKKNYCNIGIFENMRFVLSIDNSSLKKSRKRLGVFLKDIYAATDCSMEAILTSLGWKGIAGERKWKEQVDGDGELMRNEEWGGEERRGEERRGEERRGEERGGNIKKAVGEVGG